MKHYVWAMLVVIGNMYASEVYISSSMQEEETFECFKTHWNSGSKGFPRLNKEFRYNKDFNFGREFTYGDITATLLQIAVKLEDQNGIRSLFSFPGGIQDREDLLDDMQYIQKTFKYASLNMMKFLSGPGFFNLEMNIDDPKKNNNQNYTMRGFYDTKNKEYYFERVPLCRK